MAAIVQPCSVWTGPQRGAPVPRGRRGEGAVLRCAARHESAPSRAAPLGARYGGARSFLGSSRQLQVKVARAERRGGSGDGAAVRVVAAAAPLKVIISGAPASGKGTQCELIVEKFGLAHISAGDLLRVEVKEGTPNGVIAKSYMDAGKLVPDEVVVNIVKDRLNRADAQEKGWLLDGFPRSASQGNSLVEDGIVPDVFILLNVPDKVIVERVVGRRMDPETGKIYHLTFSPPPTTPKSWAAWCSAATTRRRRLKPGWTHMPRMLPTCSASTRA